MNMLIFVAIVMGVGSIALLDHYVERNRACVRATEALFGLHQALSAPGLTPEHYADLLDWRTQLLDERTRVCEGR